MTQSGFRQEEEKKVSKFLYSNQARSLAQRYKRERESESGGGEYEFEFDLFDFTRITAFRAFGCTIELIYYSFRRSNLPFVYESSYSTRL